MNFYEQMVYSAPHPGTGFYVHPDSLSELSCLEFFSPEGRVALQSEEQTWQCHSAWSPSSRDFASSWACSLQNKPCLICSDAGFIISSGTIRWAGERLVWTRLSLCHLELWMGGSALPQLLPQSSVGRRLKIPDDNKIDKTTPTTEEERTHDAETGSKRRRRRGRQYFVYLLAMARCDTSASRVAPNVILMILIIIIESKHPKFPQMFIGGNFSVRQ